jgi:predicted MarR family transcription regulator
MSTAGRNRQSGTVRFVGKFPAHVARISEFDVIDDEFALCTLCNTSHRWVRMKLADESEVVLTGR